MKGIVLHFSQTVYWPIPKNACTTLKLHIIDLLKINNSGNPHLANFEWTDTPIPGYHDWALVRNPYSRLYSLWVNKIAEGHPEGKHFVKGLDTHVFKEPLGDIRSGMPFAEFANEIFNGPIPGNHHWTLQSRQVPEGCDCQKMEDLGWFMQGLFGKHNHSHIVTPWQDAYTPELKDKVYQYYEEDFKRFGYLKYPQRILIDCDGVLTDGRVNIDHTGEKKFKSFHTRDVRAIRELIANGYDITLVTCDDWGAVFHFANKVGADVQVCREKVNFPMGGYIAVGDDAWDVGMLKGAEMAFVPANADRSVKCLGNVVCLDAYGGEGVMAEVCRRLLS